MGSLKVAIVGCGYVTEGHMSAWKKVPKVTIVAVSDINERLAEKSAERWRIPYHYKTLSEALTSAHLDIVDICTPPQVHAVQAIEAMKNGISVLIEKPMTITVSDAQAIVDCQRETGVFAGVLHNWLFDEPVLEARAMVAKGDIGEVFNITVEALSRKQDSMVVNEHHWSHKFPGGRLSEMLAHPIYLVRHFLGGDLEVSDVKVSKLSDYPWMKSDELCATFKVGPKMGRTYVSFNSSRDAIYINLYGKKGIIKLDIINSTINILPKMEVSRLNKGFDSLRQASQLVKSAAKNTSKVMLRRWSTGHDNYIKLFAKNLINNCPPPVTVEDGLAVIKTVEDICKKIEEQEKN